MFYYIVRQHNLKIYDFIKIHKNSNKSLHFILFANLNKNGKEIVMFDILITLFNELNEISLYP